MARIYKRTDRLSIKIDDVIIKVSPLSLQQKSEIQALMLQGRVKGDVKALNEGLGLMLKYSIKGIEGVETEDGPYVLNMENDMLSDECINDLMNLDIAEKLSLVCTGLVNKIPSEFTDQKGEKLEGVEYVKKDSGPK